MTDKQAPHIDANIEWWYCFAILNNESGSKYAVMASFFEVGEIEQSKGHYLIFSFSDLNSKKFLPYSVIDTKLLFNMLAFYLPIYLLNNPWDINTKKLLNELSKFRLPQPHRKMGAVSIKSDLTKLSFGDKELSFFDGGNFKLKLSADNNKAELIFTPETTLTAVGETGKPDNLYYFSYTRNKVYGKLIINGQEEKVQGSGWYDHQWGTEYKLLLKSGWNWFGIQLEDKRQLLVNSFYYLENSKTYSPMVNLINENGVLKFSRNVLLKPKSYWKSPYTANTYPIEWDIDIIDFNMKINIKAIFESQEMPIIGPLQAIWEGSCYITVQEKTSQGIKTVNGTGFMELVGYASKTFT